jgi:integrase
MKYVYTSGLATEMIQYLKLLSDAGRYTSKIQSTLRGFDKHLVSRRLLQKKLKSEFVLDWIKTRNVRPTIKAANIMDLNGFAKYLISLGIEAEYSEVPKFQSNYAPYIFTDDEINRIFNVADNFESAKNLTRSAKIFPILLRLLYSCGLRLGEGLSLRWCDTDLNNCVITIRAAKNRKQRLVPMSESMTEVLKDYQRTVVSDGICTNYLFESNINCNNPFRNNSFYCWFMGVLDLAGIHYAKHNRRERGPCPHCLRHLFTLKSFLKSETEGRDFGETSPFLAAYLGHDSIKDTEAYLRSNHTVYAHSHQRVDSAIGHLFPEVCFDEE